MSESAAATPSVRWVPYGPSATEELQREIAAAKGSDALQRVTVVAPTKVSGLGLRRELSNRRGGSVGVGFLVVAQLAELLAAPRVAARGLRPLTEDVRLQVVRESLRRAPGSLGHLAAHPATIRVVDQAFATLREATAGGGEEELVELLRGLGGLQRTVADAFACFRELTAPTRYDEHDLALLAAEITEEDAGRVRDEVGPVIVHLPTTAAPASGRLLGALAAAVRVTVLLGHAGDDVADGSVADIGRRLSGVPVEAPGDATPQVEHGEVDAIVAPDAEEEVRQAARLVSEALHRGDDISRMAVLYRSREPYAALAHELLDAAGIPHNGPTERTVGQTMAGRFLWDLWVWADGDHPRSELFDVLGSVPVRVDGERVPAERWDRIARRARVLGGRAHWDQRLAGFAASCQRDIDHGAADWIATKLEKDRDHARELRTFALSLIDALRPPADLTWTGWSGWALSLLGTYLGRSRRGWPDADIDAEGTLRQQLAALSSLDDLPDELGIEAHPVEADQARAAIAALLDEPAGRVGRSGTGVYVGPVGTAGILPAHHAIILGAVEGQFPPTPRDSVLLPEDDLAEIGRETADGTALAAALAAIPTRASQVVAARQALHRAVAGSARVTMTVPRADRREQRAKVPGPWLLDLLGRRHGERVRVAQLLEEPTPPTGVRTVASSLAALHAAPVAAGVDELRLRVLSEAATDGADLLADPLVQATPAVAHGLEIASHRGGASFTAFDGHVDGADEFLRERLERPQSPNTLADYSTCPRRYLFTQVLGIRAEDEPRRWLDVDALDRGVLVHDTLEVWIAETLTDVDDAPPRSTDIGSDERLFEIYDAKAAELEATGRTGIPALWAIEKERIRRRLRVWLGQEREHREREGVEPAAVERPFGMGDGGDAELTIDTAVGATLALRGKIDRIDAAPDGSRVVVTDYKTSKPDTYKGLADDIALAGAELQLPVYGLAASRRYPDAHVDVGYWHIHDKAVKNEPKLVPFDTPARVRTQEVLDTIAAGVTSGVFPAIPGGETTWPRPTFDNCTYCVFDRICPSHAERARAAERDLTSDAVSVLLPLWQATDTSDDEGEEP